MNCWVLSAWSIYLHHLQQSLLHKLLDLAWVLDVHVLAEGIFRSALRVLSESVGRKLLALPQHLAVLEECMVSMGKFSNS
jgi:hypothetical protein